MQLKIMAKLFCFIFLVNATGHAMKEQEIDASEIRKKIKLYDLIVNALENNSAPDALIWVNRWSTFALNGKKFTEYYQKKTDSRAKWSSLKNRLARSKTSFYAIENAIPPTGYTKLYSHETWTLDPPTMQPPITTASIISDPQGLIFQFGQILDRELIPNLLLKRQPMARTTMNFDVAQFLTDWQSISNISNDDKENLRILLKAEGPGLDRNNNILSNQALQEFGIRFGDWRRIVENVREFVNEGAREWFYGKCDGETAVNILKLAENREKDFIIRSVPIESLWPENHYVFAITYRVGNEINHQRIYRDVFDRFWMWTEEGSPINFYNFTEIIKRILNMEIDEAKIKAVTNPQIWQ